MGSLIGLVKPLLHIMMAAIILGTMGYLCAIFLTILAGQVIVHGLLTGVAGTEPFGAKHVACTYPGKNDTHGDDRDRSRCCAAFCIMRSSTATTLLLLNCWRSSAIKCLQLCGSSARRSWKDGTKEIDFDYHNRYRTSGSILCAYDFPDCDCSINFDYGMLHWKIPCSGRAACTCGVSDGRRCDPDVERKRGSQKGMEFRTGFGELNSFVLDSCVASTRRFSTDRAKNGKSRCQGGRKN